LKRIVPAYWVAFVVITYVLRAESGGPGWKGPLVFLSFTQIYFPHYILNGLSQAWSLCTEMTFYLMIPLYAYVLGRKARPVESQLRAELTGLAALTAVSFIYRIPVLMAGSPPPGPATRNLVEPHRLVDVMPSWLPAYADQFALGMLLAVGSAYLVTVDRKPAWLWHPAAPWVCWSLAGLAFWAVSNIGLPLEPVKASPLGLSLARQTLYGLFAFFLVLPAVFGPQDRGLIRATLQWRPLALVGVVSYGVYLWHEGWMHMYLVWSGDHLFDINWFAMTGAVTVLAIASATLSYRLVERPVQRSGWGLKPSGGPRFRRRLAPDARVVTLIGARS
jgi:peptidoglycan/LPS O-acetylase OafA/YrhL